ncbi:MAG: cohesin domain-containing protein [Bacteroidota bacterium]
MKIKQRLFMFGICLLTAVSLSAQLGLVISDASGETGERVAVEVMVMGFSDVTSMQFSVNWDSTILRFESIDNLTPELPGFSEREIGLLDAPSGAIRVAWFDNAISGVSIPDSTALFTLQFEVIAETPANSNITISDEPIVIEFTDSNNSAIELSSVVEGAVTVGDQSTSITYLPAPNGMELYQNEPNPFRALTNITAIFPSTEPAQLQIADVTGKIVYQYRFQAVQGKNTIAIGSNLLNTPGTYYYTLKSDRYQLTRKMILIP